MGSIESEFAGSGEYRQTSTDPANCQFGDNQSSDPDLSELLDQVIDTLPEDAIAGKCSDVAQNDCSRPWNYVVKTTFVRDSVTFIARYFFFNRFQSLRYWRNTAK